MAILVNPIQVTHVFAVKPFVYPAITVKAAPIGTPRPNVTRSYSG